MKAQAGSRTHRQLGRQIVREPGMPLDLGDADAVVRIARKQAADKVPALAAYAPWHWVSPAQDGLPVVHKGELCSVRKALIDWKS